MFLTSFNIHFVFGYTWNICPRLLSGFFGKISDFSGECRLATLWGLSCFVRYW